VRAVARGGAANLVGAAVTTVANLLLAVVVARSLQTTDAGIFFSVTSLVLVLATVGRLGTGDGLVYFLPRLRLAGSADELTASVRLALRPVLVASALLGVALFVLAPQVGSLIAADAPGTATLALRLAALALPFAAAGEVLQSGTRGFGQMRTTVLVERIARPAAQLVLVFAAAGTGSAVLLVAAWAAPYLPAMMLSVFPLRRLLNRERDRRAGFAGSGFDSRRFWSFTAPRAMTAVTQVALQRLGIILVAVIVGSADAAVFAAATRFLVVGQLGNQAISLALQPRLSAALGREDRRLAGSLYQTATCWLVLMTWPLYLLAIMFPAALLSVFGGSYVDATEVVVILCSAMLVATGCGQVDSVLMMAGRSTWNMANALLALAVNVGVNLVLLPRIGIVGAAVGWAAAILTANLVPLAQVWWSIRVHPFGRATILAMIVTVSATLLGALPLRLLGGDEPVPAVVAALLSGSLLVAVVWPLRRRFALFALQLRRAVSA